MKTNSESLEKLFDALADEFSDILTDGKKVIVDGKVQRVSPDASTLNTIRQFLKDTNTNIAPGSNPKVNKIGSQLPFDGEENEGDHLLN